VVTGAALVVFSIVLLGLALAVDGSDDEPSSAEAEAEAEAEDRDRGAPGAEATTTSSTEAPRDPILGNGEPVTFAFGGDVHFERHIRSRLDADPAAVFAPVAPMFAEADVSMVNLETAVTEGGEPVPKEYTFRVPMTAFDALRLGNVDVATMANNHGLDYGPVGFEDTMVAIETTGYPVVGVGRNAEQAYSPWRTEVRGQRIAVFGGSEVIDTFLREEWRATDERGGMASVYPEGIDRMLEAIRAERSEADTIVVYLHYGREGETCPNERQVSLAQRLTEAGADIVVGSHAHRLQGGGRMGSAFVAYGLGNFVFYNEDGGRGDSGVLRVTATGRQIDGYDFAPARIRNGVPTPLEGAAADSARSAWDAQRECTGLTP
jgi:poly-gamma-glutamate synthesis protein (capsule biosynthesis protein)